MISAPGGGGGPHLDKGQLPCHRLMFRDVRYPYNLDQLVQLLGDLHHRILVAGDHEGHAGEAGLLALADGEAGDVESAPAEQAGDAGQDTRLVLDQGHDGMFFQSGVRHDQPPPDGGAIAASGSSSIIS